MNARRITNAAQSRQQDRAGLFLRLYRELALAFAVLTILPVARRGTWREEDLPHAMAFFPVVGAALGAAAWGLDLLLAHAFGPMARAGLLVAFFAILTGGLHLDGLADTCDGLFSRAKRERALEIMRDSRVGALGAAAMMITLLLKFSLLASLAGPLRGAALLLLPVAGRQAMVLVAALFPTARPNTGLSDAFARRVARTRLALSLIMSAAAIVAGWGILVGHGLGVGAVQCAAVLTGGFGVALLAALAAAWAIARRLGGLTGDIYGAMNELAEMVSLLLATGLQVLV